MSRRILVCGAVVAWAWYAASPAPSADEPAKPAAKPAEKQAPAEPLFLRVTRDANKTPTALQTSVVRYVGKKGKYAGATVDLIGAVHIGDKAYYRELNRRFTTYETLLYELVAPKGTKIPKGGRGGSSHPVGMMQEGMTGVLGLAHQLEEVDYTKKNFVHADMTPKQFSDKMEEKGESWWSMMFTMMGHSMAIQAGRADQGAEFELLAAMFAANRELALKRALAKQFEEMEVMMDVFEGEEGSTIITERNKAAFKVLEKELAAGKKRVGVFYGAGHLTDMDERLRNEFGLEREKVEWLTAWDLRDPVKKPAAGKRAKKAVKN